MTRLAALALLAVAAGGCSTTLAGLRESPPLRTAVVAAPSAPELAACAMDGLETGDFTEDLSYRLLTRGGESSVLGTIPWILSPGHVPVIEATFTPTSDGVRVETRGHWGILAPKLDRHFWPIIERCAGLPVVAR